MGNNKIVYRRASLAGEMQCAAKYQLITYDMRAYVQRGSVLKRGRRSEEGVNDMGDKTPKKPPKKKKPIEKPSVLSSSTNAAPIKKPKK